MNGAPVWTRLRERLAPTYTVLLLRNMAWAITLSGPVMPLYVRSLGVDIVYWGILAAALSAGLFMEAIWGAVLDRVYRRLFVLVALIATSLIYPLYTVKALLPLARARSSSPYASHRGS